jgi:hypothetical protein
VQTPWSERWYKNTGSSNRIENCLGYVKENQFVASDDQNFLIKDRQLLQFLVYCMYKSVHNILGYSLSKSDHPYVTWVLEKITDDNEFGFLPIEYIQAHGPHRSPE